MRASTRHKHPFWQNVLAGLFALVVLLCAWYAGKYMVSAVAEYFSQAHLDTWSERAELPDEAEWLRAKNQLSLSISMTSGNPRVQQLGGRLYEWRIEMAKANGEDTQPFIESALDFYRRSIELRPLWPYAWLQFTQAKLRAKQFDDEFRHAYSMSFRFGPWEEDVYAGLVEVGFAAFKQLGKDNQNVLLNSARRMADNPKTYEKLIKAGKRHKKLLYICYGVPDNKRIQIFCHKNKIKL